MSIRHRVERLEDQAEKAASQWQIPPEVLVLLKAVARDQAREGGLPSPAYTQEEIEEMRRQDLDLLGGELEKWRSDPGWQDEESQSMLDEWEEAARRRLEKVKDLPPECWSQVWGVDEEDEQLEGETYV